MYLKEEISREQPRETVIPVGVTGFWFEIEIHIHVLTM